MLQLFKPLSQAEKGLTPRDLETVGSFQIEAVITVVGDDEFRRASPRWLNWSCELLTSHCDFTGFYRCSNASTLYPITGIAVSPAPFAFTS